MKDSSALGLAIAGLSGGSGKSVVSVGLVAALKQAGNEVVTFKKGPDYIDAGWLTTASGRPCYNLDPYLMSEQAIADSFAEHVPAGGYAIVEGNRGVYDGVNPEGGFSTAELAIQLDLPVLLVVNCTKTTRTVAAMVLGCRMFDQRLRICGVVLNHIATSRQESVIRAAVEQYAGVPVLGVMPRLKQDIFPMRHLGVTPHQEYEGARAAVENLARIGAQHFDIKAICNSMREVFPRSATENGAVAGGAQERVTIGILRDVAFQFYYEENLEALRRLGADLVMIDALNEPALPSNLDALYIGGGFPETSASALAANAGFRESVKKKAGEGLPIYAECGGLIYLGKSIVMDGVEYPLTGVFPVTFGIAKKPQAHGYSTFTVEQANAFYPEGTVIKGHEFRYSTVASWDGDPRADLAVQMMRGTGFVDGRDGLRFKSVLALYTHVLASGTPEWATGIIGAARRYRVANSSE